MSSNAIQIEQARRLFSQGKADQARATLLRVLQRAPTDPGANQAMALVLAGEGKHEQALFYIDRAITAQAGFAPFHILRGTILSNTPRVGEAIPSLRRAVELEPANAGAWAALGTIQQGLRQHAEAENSLRNAGTLDPGNPDLAAALGSVLLETGRPEQAVDVIRAAIERAGGRGTPRALETLAFCLNYDPRATPPEVFEAHRAFGRALESSVAGARGGPPPARASGPGGRVRLGYLSPDLRDHAVSTFFAPVLEHHDRAAFEVFVYHSSPVVDDVTTRLRGAAEHWFGSRLVPDAELLARLRADRLDILVELSGLTAQNRLPVLARRPAPVQASFIGYPNTTGLTSIDWLIVDRHVAPPGHEALATERLARLPHCLLCYDPPDVPPATRGGRDAIQFASFNTLGKTTDATLRLWARVMEQVPASRLVLKATGLSDARVHETFIARARAAGIDADRLSLLGHTPKGEHLRSYAQADVCLDPFPFGGATTTCDALFMGTPVVTLEGDRHVSRASASILRTIGRSGWIGAGEDEYVRIACDLARDPDARQEAHRSLRGQVLASPLCDATGYTRALEDLYRSMLGARGGAC